MVKGFGNLFSVDLCDGFLYMDIISLLYLDIYIKIQPVAVPQTCNPSTLGGLGRQIT